MPPRKPTGHDRRLKWGDGWIEERIAADGTIRYQARWTEAQVNGTTIKRSATFPTLDQAETKLREVGDSKAHGTYTAPERLTVEQLVRSWIERGIYEWKPSTVATYRQRASSLITPHLGTILVSALTPPRVQFWVDTMVKLKVAPNTIDATTRVLSGAFRDAVRLGIVPSNPVTGTRKPTIRQKKVTVWTAEEARKVIAHVADDPMWNAVYRLHLATGVRPGELQVIRWADLDLVNGVLTVSRTMTKDEDGHQVIGETTKTGRPRAIALSASVVTALTVWRKAQVAIRLACPEWEDNDLVFTTAYGRLITQRHWQDHLTGVIAATGVKVVTRHQIRHTAATLLLERGVHAKIVAEILGHQDIATTLNLYSHVGIALQRRTVDDMASWLFDDERDAGTG